VVLIFNKKAMYNFGKAIFGRDNVLPKLAELDLPVAVIVGDEDTLTRPIHSERMATTIPGAKLYKIADAGHSAAIEKAPEVTQAMVEFYGI
jgi:pimeloyl-ACP methyl ester carboxylesterase